MAAGCLALNLAGASGYDLLTDDEIRYAEAGRRMLETGDWILPEYNGFPRYQKPILFYWLQAITQAIFGFSPLAARLPSALAGMGVVLLTAQMGNALWGRRAGLWAGWMLALSVEMLLLSRMAMTDVILLLFLQGACNCFCFAQLRESVGEWESGSAATLPLSHTPTLSLTSRWLYRGMFACLALGVLTKGPIALVLPAAAILPWLALTVARDSNPVVGLRRIGILRHRAGRFWTTVWRMRPWEGIAILLLIAGPWYYWVDWHTHGQFTRHFFLDENLGRFTSVVNEHHQPALFYWLLLIPMTFPWTGFLPSAVRSCLSERVRECESDSASALQLSHSLMWLFLLQIAVVVVLFSFSRTKVWTYILPAFPSLALITGRWLSSESTVPANHRTLRGFAWLFAGIALAVAMAAMLWPAERLPLELQSPEVLASLRVCLWLLFTLSVAMLVVVRRGSVQQTAIGLACGAALWYLTILFVFLPAYDRHWKQPVREVCAAMRQYPQAKAVVYRMHELAVNSYGGVAIVRQWRSGCRTGLEDLLSCREPIFVLCPAEHLADFDGLRFHRWGENCRFVWGANFPAASEQWSVGSGQKDVLAIVPLTTDY